MHELSAVESIFLAALAKPTLDERAAYLDAACPDAELRRRVERLLEAHPRAGSFLNGTAPVPAGDHETATVPLGTVIGPYKLMEQIGEGGMGLVFVAEQHHPVRRKVALKVIKPGMDTRQVIARFEAERQALAMMDHPHIARVLDAGATDSGRPYFVMELVRGVPITEYCDANSYAPRERLSLFLQVCQAVQHAHQKGVIHRDLKPSNILVSPHDGVPVVKVIDFGVAKALGQQLTERTIYTRFAQVIGTPLYMSPEQAEVNQLDVDTRSDVYSLGVLLYELLTGTTPFDRQRFQDAAFEEIRRILREEEPPRPSTRLTSLGATLTTVSARRGTDPGRLSRLVRGELDWVVMRCLEKDRSRRYDTVAGLAKDVKRFLADEPVEARPASPWYRLRKTCRRHRAVVSTVAGFALLLVAGMTLVTWKWRAESSARADADNARYDAEQKAQEIIAAAERMNEATAAMELAGQHALLGNWSAAEAEHDRSIELRRDHSLVWMRRGDLYADMGLWELAAADYAQSFDCRPPDMVRRWYFHALLQLLAGNDEAYRETCRQMTDRFGASTDAFTRGNLVRACSLEPGVVADHDRLLGPVDEREIDPAYTWVPLYTRGLASYRAGHFEEAVRDLRESLASTDSHARAMIYPVLAMALYRAGQSDAAREELQRSREELDRWTRAGLSDRPVPWTSWWDWAEFHVYHAEAHGLIEASPLPEDPRTFVLRGRALSALGRIEEAAPEYAKAVRLARDDFEIRSESFRFRAAAERWAEAEADLAEMKRIRPHDAQVHVKAFRTFADHGQWDRALAEHAAAVRLRPADVEILLERFRYHAARGESAAAEAAYADAVKKRAHDVAFRVQCGDVCAKFKQWAKARDEYARTLDGGMLGDGELNRDAWLRLAVLQLYLGDVEDYRRTCATLVERHAGDDNWRTTIALIRICLLDPDPGVSPDRFAALPRRLSLDDSRGVHGAAMFALRLGKDDVDLEALQAALREYQWDTQRVALARVFHARGDYYSARYHMNRVAVEHRRVDPELTTRGERWDFAMEAQLWYRQAEAVIQPERWRAVDELVRSRRWADAIDSFASLMTPANKSAIDWGTRAACFAELGRWSESAADSARARELAPDYLPGALKDAAVSLKIGDRARYVELCRHALARHSDATDRDVLNDVGWLCALDGAAAAEAARALPLIEKALAGAPVSHHLHTRACLLYRVGRHADAVRQLNELTAQPGYVATAYDWLFLAMAHHHLGHKDEAHRYLDESIAWITANPPRGWEARAELELFRAEAEGLIAPPQ